MPSLAFTADGASAQSAWWNAGGLLAPLLGDSPDFGAGFWLPLAATIAATFAIWLGTRVWRWASSRLGQLSRRLGTTWPLRRFAVREYLSQVRERYETISNLYLNDEHPLNLGEIFVPLTLRERAHNSQDRMEPLTRDARTVLTDPQNGRLMILGGPGSGKTTLLKALASGTSRRQWGELEALIPIYIRLRSYSQAGGEPALQDWMGEQLRDDYDIPNGAPLLRSLRRSGKLLVLLDGLDEIGEEAVKRVPARIVALAEWLTGAGSSRIVVTCREQNFDRLADPGLFPRRGFAVYRLADMRDAEVEAMVTRREPYFVERGKSRDHFLGKIRAVPHVADLHRNPLLLTLSIALYLGSDQDRVPRDLAEFFDEGIDNLIKRHDALTLEDQRDGLTPRNTTLPQAKLELLQRFSLKSLIRAGELGLDFEIWPAADLIRAAQGLAEESLDVKQAQAETLVAELHQSAGLITDIGDGLHFSFVHRSLHEFCAARELLKRGEAGFELALRNCGNKDWAQVLIFYASLTDPNAERLVEALLEAGCGRGSHELLALAGRCAAVLRLPLIELRLQVADALAGALRDAVDESAVSSLLDALIRLGRSEHEPVLTRVFQAVRELLDVDRPERIASEIGRLGLDTALEIVKLLMESRDPAKLRAALAGLNSLEGLDIIPTLWKLIDVLAERDGCTAELSQASKRMAEMLSDPAAVGRLESQPQYLAQHLDIELVHETYPFTEPGAPPGNLAYLLTMLRTLGVSADELLQGAAASHTQG